ncbi:unnamed protein product [Moneuplotes crassus]|uniref:Uncharacterized protein n=1 Tax=Euplotes crassus TaxID=5936 RepID=A0AAD2D643_EUPCR|nr:unnamed protein product [Moneuplotes crassus]
MKRKASLSPFMKDKLSSSPDGKNFGFNTIKKSKISSKPNLRIAHRPNLGPITKNLKVIPEDQGTEDKNLKKSSRKKRKVIRGEEFTDFKCHNPPEMQTPKKVSQNSTQHMESPDLERDKCEELYLSRSSSCLDMYGSLMNSKDIRNKNVGVGSQNVNNPKTANPGDNHESKRLTKKIISLRKEKEEPVLMDTPNFHKKSDEKTKKIKRESQFKAPSHERVVEVDINSIKVKNNHLNKGKRNFEYISKTQVQAGKMNLEGSSDDLSNIKERSLSQCEFTQKQSRVNSSEHKFDGFRDDDDIVINPEFGRSLKASLKASKRRLMLFIDTNNPSNPPSQRSKFSSKNPAPTTHTKISTTGHDYKAKPCMRYVEETDGKRASLGLKKEDIVQSVEKSSSWHETGRRNEDLVLWEFEPLPRYFRGRKK